MKKWSPVLAAVLGIIIGALCVITIDKYREEHQRLEAGTQWRKLELVLQSISENYVDSVDYETVSRAAIDAALGELDPHSIYMPPVDLEQSEEDLAGSFDGIGIQFNVPNDTAIIIEVIPGGPSEKIGLQSGDRIIKVDSVVIAGVNYPQDSMVRRMKGPSGTKVTVTVGRDGELVPFEITRGKIPTHSVDCAFMVNDTTGYLRLSKFSRTTFREVVLAGTELLGEGMTRLILDIRDNTGGFFDQALMLSNLFLRKDAPIVYLEGLHRDREEFNADGSGAFQDVELCVLINESSASSSEIFAGAMQDNARAEIIGRRSFGKGLVQEPVYFSDGSAIRLTVARFYTPSGRCLQKPYSDDYTLEVYKRYGEGEMVEADSMKLEKGGIIPDIFVPVDTTRASDFYIECNRKATAMRFASSFFDEHKAELGAIEDYQELLRYLDSSSLESRFLAFARAKDGLVPDAGWAEEREYMLAQVRALVGRYSRLGDNAFYHLYLPVDNVFQKSIGR